jgi:hypothetical protein
MSQWLQRPNKKVAQWLQRLNKNLIECGHVKIETLPHPA